MIEQSLRSFFCAAMLLAATAVIAAADDPTGGAAGGVVVIKSPSTCQYGVYDPKHPPAEMPTTMPDEQAFTYSEYQIQTTLGGTVTLSDRRDGAFYVVVRVKAARIAIHMQTTIWLMENGSEKIRDHEAGHLRISEIFYSDADAVARTIGRGIIGKNVFGHGQTADAAAHSALLTAGDEIDRQYMMEVRDPAASVQDRYDRITQHGANAVKESNAIEQAMKEAGGKAD